MPKSPALFLRRCSRCVFFVAATAAALLGPTTNQPGCCSRSPDTLKWEPASNVKGKIPAGRNGHTATLAKGKIFVIGGWLGSGPLAANDLHMLTVDTMRWEEPRTLGKPPGPCNMHTADYIDGTDRVFVFRGGDGREYLNDLHTLHVDEMQWDEPATTGQAPLPRANHSSAIMGQQIFIFGGWDGHKRLNDVHILDCATLNWTSPKVLGELPSSRAGMTFSRVRNRLFLFGGSGPAAKCFNDLQVLDPETLTWLDVRSSGANGGGGGGGQGGGGGGGGSGGRNDRGGGEDEGKSGGGGGGGGSNGGGHMMIDQKMAGGGDHYGGGGGGSNWGVASSDANPNSCEEDQEGILVIGDGPGRRAGHTTTVVDRR